jgi:hypothetical protein
MKATPTLINHTLCEDFFGKYKIQKDGMFCGGFFDSEGESIDVADDFEKGGLLMCQDKPEEDPDSYVVCGLKSYTPVLNFLCDEPNDDDIRPSMSDTYPMTFTRISNYIDWIESVLDKGYEL